MPDGSTAAARSQPPVVSWSVRASTPSPAAAAVVTSSSGVSVPSETVEWVCRSIRARADDTRRLSAPAVAGQHPGRPGLALLAEHQLGEGLVDLLRAGHVVDAVQR